MSAEDRKKIELAALVIGTLLAIAAALGTFVVLPYRMTAAESAIRDVQQRTATDHDVLTRIDSRTEEIQRALARLEKRP